MAKLPHLPLERVERTEDRRKVPAPVLPPTRPSPRGHGETIKSKVDAAVAEQTALPQIKGIDPELILKVSLAAPVQEDAWRLAGFNILAQEPNNILVVFSDDTELREFRARLAEYQKGPQGEQKAPSHNALLACIEEVGGIAPTDRIGPRLRSEGIASPGAIDAQEAYTVDIELWDAPTRQDREVRVQNVVTHIEGREGELRRTTTTKRRAS
jgi:hypothetical protein